jgi:hypothetical protein
MEWQVLSLVGVLAVGLCGEDGLEVGDELLDGGLAVGVEEVEDDDDGELGAGGRTLRTKAMMERVRTKEEVPDAPLFW